jgi:uncharacterized protein YbjT (DUF2867 family)
VIKLKAVVVGATGLVGAELVRLLLNNKKYSKVIVIARRRLSIVHPRLEQQLISFEELEACPEAWFEEADVFCTLGTTIKKAKTKEKFQLVDYHYVVELGKLVKKHHAKKMLVVTAMGSNESSVFFYSKVKGMTERVLQELKLPQLIIIRPSLILGNRNQFRLGEVLAAKLSSWLSFAFRGKMSKYKPNEAKDIALAMSKLAFLCKEPLSFINSGDILYWSKQRVN